MVFEDIVKLVLVTILLQRVSGVSRCCPEEQVLEVSNMTCVPRFSELVENSGGYTDVEALFDSVGFPKCDKIFMDVLSDEESDLTVDDNEVLTRNDNVSSRTFPKESFCVDLDSGSMIVLVCPCTAYVCLNKCCPHDELLDLVESMCVPAQDKNYAFKFRNYLRSSAATDFYVLKSQFVRGLCPDDATLASDTDDEFRITENGNALFTATGPVNYQEYCLDFALSESGDMYPELLICVKPYTEAEVQNTVYSIMLFIGCVFLAMSIVVYAMLPELRNRLHGMSFLSHCGSLLIAFFAIAISRVSGEQERNACRALVFIIQYFFVASFFWLNVMSIDIAWTFSGIRPIYGDVLQRDRKKFMFYSIYAWGATAVLSIITAIMEFSPDVSENSLKPRIGEKICWFDEETSVQFAYFYAPISVLLFVNLILFGFTVFKLMKRMKKTRRTLKRTDSKRHSEHANDRRRFLMHLKLFMLMGLGWITDVISAAAGGSAYIWIVSDTVNMLVGVFIFVIFVCKREVLHLLANRYPRLKFLKGKEEAPPSDVTTETTPSIPLNPIKN